jgi:1,4-alpha-glucan branching enzyme
MVVVESNGLVTFTVYRPGAARVELQGDFTAWGRSPVEMRPQGDGWWTARTAVPPGDHAFCYLADGASWMPDYAAHGVKANGFGGWVSQISIAPEPLRQAA